MIGRSSQGHKAMHEYVESSLNSASRRSLVCWTPGCSASRPNLQDIGYIHLVHSHLVPEQLAGSKSQGGACEASCSRADASHLHPSQTASLQSEDLLESDVVSSLFLELLQQLAEEKEWWFASSSAWLPL